MKRLRWCPCLCDPVPSPDCCFSPVHQDKQGSPLSPQNQAGTMTQDRPLEAFFRILLTRAVGDEPLPLKFQAVRDHYGLLCVKTTHDGDKEGQEEERGRAKTGDEGGAGRRSPFNLMSLFKSSNWSPRSRSFLFFSLVTRTLESCTPAQTELLAFNNPQASAHSTLTSLPLCNRLLKGRAQIIPCQSQTASRASQCAQNPAERLSQPLPPLPAPLP